jgi:hypothetical protein
VQRFTKDQAVEFERLLAAKQRGKLLRASVDQKIISRWRQAHRPTEARVNRVELYLLPVATRMPLKFDSETLTTVTCASPHPDYRPLPPHSKGWGETPRLIVVRSQGVRRKSFISTEC